MATGSPKSKLFTAITRFGRSPAGRRAARLVEGLDRAFENDNSDHLTNGEAWLVRSLDPLGPTCVVDVGANVGTWSELVVAELQLAHVYAFEPVPATYEELVQRVGRSPRLTTRNAALTGSDAATITMWTGAHSTIASAVARHDVPSESVKVDALRGDDFCQQEAIDHVDLLKVDVEGHDLEVLLGFERMLKGGQVDVVQFEFTLFAIYARTWLADFYSLLEPLGYSIGKLYPTWIDWRPYDAHHERFLRCNFVAVRRDTPAHRRLGAPGPV